MQETPTNWGRKWRFPRSITPRTVWKPQPHGLTAETAKRQVGFVEPAPPGEDNISCPDHNTFHAPKTPTNRGRKRWSPRPIPLRTVWSPQPGVRSSQRHPGQDKVSTPGQKSFYTSSTPTNWERKRWPPGLIPPRTLWKPLNMRFIEPAPPGEDKVTSRIGTIFIPLQLQQTGDENGGPPGRYRPARCGNPNPTG